jgi:hypothetical protein
MGLRLRIVSSLICARRSRSVCGAATAHMNMAAAFATSTARYIAALGAQRLAASGRADDRHALGAGVSVSRAISLGYAARRPAIISQTW